MKKSSIIWVSLFLISSLFGCSLFNQRTYLCQYDNSPVHVDPAKKQLEEVASNLFRIQTFLKFKLGEATQSMSAIGLATSLDPRHLLTARHVVKIESFQRITPFGLIEFQIPEEDKLEEEIFIIFDDGSRMKTQIVYSDKEKDFALLKVDKEIHYSPLVIGNSDHMKAGDFLFLIGNFQTGLNIRTGYVTQSNFVRYGAKGEVFHVNENLFGISAVTVEGDSGAPIFLLRKGKLELGGIVIFLMTQARGLGFGVKINPIMDQIKGYLK